MKRILLTAAASLLAANFLMAQSVELQWVGQQPSVPAGQSWGVPFSKGQIDDSRTFTLRDSSGAVLPLQQWVMARHLDGSVKWMGFASSVDPQHAEGLTLTANPKLSARQARLAARKAAENPTGIKVSETEDDITVDNGTQTVVFGKSGSSLIRSIEADGRQVARNGRLVCILEDRSREAQNTYSYNEFSSRIDSVSLEKSGPVLAVVRVDGRHSDGSRSWLPFCVRFYIYQDVAGVRMVHSIIFDGDHHSDFISGLGVEFSLPLSDELYNRHVRFAGQDGGLWSESVQPLTGRRQLIPGGRGVNEALRAQEAGERIAPYEEFNETAQYHLRNWADWADFRLTQLTPDSFEIRKRTSSAASWVGTAGGSRSEGYVQAGEIDRGLGISIKDFWQSYPKEFELSGMNTECARLTAWLWSPRAEAMDLRHYDTEGHDLESSYEDYQPGLDTPYGVARTSELTIYPYSSMPSREQTVFTAQTAQHISQIMATPQYLHDAGAFGVWSLPREDAGPVESWIEDQIDDYIAYYAQSVEAKRWYGFWNYGDVMHTYSPERHDWLYDVGGFAWANTELEPDLWLWYAFVRTGREDIWRMAYSMTRHTSEVDVYHIGEMAGLGTRHNVSHWGCGAKEARIGQAWWKRFFYYLTTDDRVGDLMHEAADADFTTLKFDPLRVAQPRSEFPTSQPTRLRWGPDWIAFVGNWFTEWERTGNEYYLNKILTGMDCLSDLPNGLFTGKGPYGYDPATGKLTYEGESDWVTNKNHLANLQGGFEVMMEVYGALGHEGFNKTYLEYCSWYSVPREDPLRSLPENAKYINWWGHWNQERMLAFAARELGDDYRAHLAWKRFLQGSVGKDGTLMPQVPMTWIDGSDTLTPFMESPRIGTNGTAQWNLEAIMMLELIGDSVPKSVEDILE